MAVEALGILAGVWLGLSGHGLGGVVDIWLTEEILNRRSHGGLAKVYVQLGPLLEAITVNLEPGVGDPCTRDGWHI